MQIDGGVVQIVDEVRRIEDSVASKNVAISCSLRWGKPNGRRVIGESDQPACGSSGQECLG